MRRKAIQLANQTIVISLPIKWVRQHGIKKGDEIEVEEKEEKIVVSIQKEPEEIKKIINLDDYGIMQNRIVLSQYLKGVDELEIKFSKPHKIKERIANKLIGFEIIKQTSNSITFKDLSRFSNQDLSQIIKRIFLIIESMGFELLESLEKNQKNLEHIIEIDEEINKMAYYAIRVLSKQGSGKSKESPLLYSIILCLESIGDKYREIAKKITEKKINLTKKDLQNIKITNEFFVLFKNFFLDIKKEKLIEWAEFYEANKNNFAINSKREEQNIFLNTYLIEITGDILMMNNNLLMTM